jgi:disease resistance protein RPS2
MVLPKGPFWEHVEETDESWQCTFCGHPFSKLTRIARFKLHWSGVPGCGTTICDKVPEHVREAVFAAVDGPPEKKLKTTATSSNDRAPNTISTSLLEQNSQVGNVVTDVETEPELYFPSPGEQEFVQTNMGNFQLDRVSSFPRDLIPGEQVEQECERNAQDNLTLSVEDYRIEGMITGLNQLLVVRGGSPERLTVDEDEPGGDSSQPGDLQCLGLQRNYDQQCSSSVSNDVNNDLCPSKKKHKATAGSSNNEVTDVISASAQEQNNEVMAQLRTPQVNMVGDPGQPVVRDSSHEALQRNGEESGRDVFLTEELTGGEFENNKNAIWSWIMNDEASSSIGIYGKGGVGKTTLLTHIYNQLLQEPDTFPRVHWITVSQDFSVYKLQNLIARDIRLDLLNEDNERKRAAKLSTALIKKQRWVLILDDL